MDRYYVFDQISKERYAQLQQEYVRAKIDIAAISQGIKHIIGGTINLLLRRL